MEVKIIDGCCWTLLQMGNDNDDLLEDKLRWADAFILVYSITDRCSLDECTRLKFLISHNANKRLSRKLSHDSCSSSGSVVALVGNKNDLEAERMVSVSEGKERSCQLGCSAFYDISVRESYEEANRVFEDLYRIMKKRTQVSKTSRKNCLKHQDAVTDSPPTPHILDCKSSLDSPSPPSPRRRESRVPVLGFSKDEPSEDHLYHNVLHISDSVSDTHLTCSDHRDQRDTQRKRSVSKRIISRVIPSLSSSSRENDSFRSDSDLTADSS